MDVTICCNINYIFSGQNRTDILPQAKKKKKKTFVQTFRFSGTESYTACQHLFCSQQCPSVVRYSAKQGFLLKAI